MYIQNIDKLNAICKNHSRKPTTGLKIHFATATNNAIFHQV